MTEYNEENVKLGAQIFSEFIAEVGNRGVVIETTSELERKALDAAISAFAVWLHLRGMALAAAAAEPAVEQEVN